MSVFTTFDISASALTAHKMRMDTISSNLANVETTSTPEGGPYKKKSVYFESTPLSFQDQLKMNMENRLQGVRVKEIIEDQSPPKLVYDPTHPDAREDGYVEMPNISAIKEMVDMMNTTRSYEANTTVIQSAKRMATKALEIGS